jgi:hypothetical protein
VARKPARRAGGDAQRVCTPIAIRATYPDPLRASFSIERSPGFRKIASVAFRVGVLSPGRDPQKPLCETAQPDERSAARDAAPRSRLAHLVHADEPTDVLRYIAIQQRKERL